MTLLPPGQRVRADFPRFGLGQFAARIPDAAPLSVAVVGEMVNAEIVLDATSLAPIPRVEQTSDLHCVTTWSATGLHWGGWRFRDVWDQCIAPHLTSEVSWIRLKSADGFVMRLPLEDALGDDVLLADRLDDAPLSILHGGPIRFVAPRHYGYKNAKHVVRISAVRDDTNWRTPTPLGFMEHPRARVALEERGTVFPGWLLRWLYRPLIGTTVRRFQAGWDAHADQQATVGEGPPSRTHGVPGGGRS